MKNFTKFNIAIIISVLLIYSCGKDDVDDNTDDNNTDTTELTTYDIVKIATDSGNIFIWLYDETPLHKANFDSLVRTGFYDGLIFHRIIDDFVIQGGDPTGTGSGGTGYRIPAEITDSLNHILDAVGAARNNNPDKESNGCQFYIVEDVNGTGFLDGDYTFFGQTIGGIDVVHKLAEVPTNSSDRLINDVVMTKVEMISLTKEELLNQYNWEVE